MVDDGFCDGGDVYYSKCSIMVDMDQSMEEACKGCLEAGMGNVGRVNRIRGMKTYLCRHPATHLSKLSRHPSATSPVPSRRLRGNHLKSKEISKLSPCSPGRDEGTHRSKIVRAYDPCAHPPGVSRCYSYQY